MFGGVYFGEPQFGEQFPSLTNSNIAGAIPGIRIKVYNEKTIGMQMNTNYLNNPAINMDSSTVNMDSSSYFMDDWVNYSKAETSSLIVNNMGNIKVNNYG